MVFPGMNFGSQRYAIIAVRGPDLASFKLDMGGRLMSFTVDLPASSRFVYHLFPFMRVI